MRAAAIQALVSFIIIVVANQSVQALAAGIDAAKAVSTFLPDVIRMLII